MTECRSPEPTATPLTTSPFTPHPSAPEAPPSPSRCPEPAGPTPPALRPRTNEAGQATAEYALVMLAAAALAGLLIAWAASTDGIGRLLDAVLDSIIEDAG